MDKKHFVLLAVAASRNKVLTPVRLQKALFLLGQAPIVPKDWYEFEAHHYGPFCRAIYRDANRLQEEGLVMRVPVDQGGWTNTHLTVDGAKKAEEVQKDMPPGHADHVHAVVDWVETKSFGQLLTSVYAAYPEYAVNSVFRGQ